MTFGEIQIRTFVERRYRFDGGAMYGIIPKVLWQKHSPADENNRIEMVNNLFVVSAYGKHMLIETGLGDTLSEREQRIHGVSTESNLDSGLAELGLTPADIDIVVLSHLHTDHAGGAVKLVDGEYVPRFPKASYVVPQIEWGEAMHPNERTAAAYHKERLRALKDAGQLLLLAVNTKLLTGIQTVHTGGHTPGHIGLEMESDGQRVVYYADIFPMLPHLRIPWVAAADLNPVESMDVKRRLLPTFVDTDTVLLFDHDIHTPLARIKSDDKGFVAEPVE